MPHNKEYENISDLLFNQFSALLFKHTGINLKTHKKYLLVHRLSKFVGPDKPFKNFKSYLKALHQSTDNTLLTGFINVLTTNFSFFFREEVHFKFLTTFLKERAKQEPYLHLWSAASSTGEEAYSMAITLLEAIPHFHQEVKILGTDISTKVLYAAIKGVYAQEKIIQSVSTPSIKNYFTYNNKRKIYEVNSQLKKLVTFRQLNLLGSYPFKKQFDVVFLRNVLIYFDNQEKERAINQIYHVLKPGGALIIGLSESMVGLSHPFSPFKNSIYLKN